MGQDLPGIFKSSFWQPGVIRPGRRFYCTSAPAYLPLDVVSLGYDHRRPGRLFGESAGPDDRRGYATVAHHVFALELVRQQVRQHVVHAHLQFTPYNRRGPKRTTQNQKASNQVHKSVGGGGRV